MKENILAFILSQGPNNINFNFSYENRSNELLMTELGESLFLLFNKIPNGILVVFSSYALMN